MNHSGYGKRLKLAGLLLALAVVAVIIAAAIALSDALHSPAYAQDPTQTPTRTPKPTPVPQCEFLVSTSDNRGKWSTRPMQFTGAQGATHFSPVEEADGQFDAVNIYGDAPCHWKATSSVDWITLRQATGTVPPDQVHEGLRFQIDGEVARHLPRGTHKGQVNFTVAAGDPGPGSTLYVELYLLGPCELTAQADFLTFDLDAGDEPDAAPALPIVISNPILQSGDCVWRANPSAEWLRVTPSRGTLPGGESVSISVKPTGAVSGLTPRDNDYNFSIQFTTENGISKSVSGALHIEPAPCQLELALSQDEFEVTGPQEGPFTPDSVRVRIRNTGGRACDWHTSDGRYFHAKKIGGTLNPLATDWFEVAVSESATTAPPGEHIDRITVNSGVAGGNAEVPLKLIVSQLPCQFTAQAAQGLDFQRNTDGSFTAPKFIGIRNAAHRQDCRWVVTPPLWLSVTPLAGILSGGATASVRIAVAQEIAAVMEEHRVHDGVIKFSGQSEIPDDLQFGATLEMGCVAAEPCVEIHSSREKIVYGENVTVTLTIRNPPGRPELTAILTLELPDGWELAPGDFGADCSSGSQCSKAEQVANGIGKLEVEASPSAPSSEDRESIFTGNVSYFYDGAARQSYSIPISITVSKAPPEFFHRTPTPAPAPTGTPAAVAPTPGGSPPVLPPGQWPDAGAGSGTNLAPAPTPFWQDWRVWALALALVVITAGIVVVVQAIIKKKRKNEEDKKRDRDRKNRRRLRQRRSDANGESE